MHPISHPHPNKSVHAQVMHTLTVCASTISAGARCQLVMRYAMLHGKHTEASLMHHTCITQVSNSRQSGHCCCSCHRSSESNHAITYEILLHLCALCSQIFQRLAPAAPSPPLQERGPPAHCSQTPWYTP